MACIDEQASPTSLCYKIRPEKFMTLLSNVVILGNVPSLVSHRFVLPYRPCDTLQLGEVASYVNERRCCLDLASRRG